MWYLIDRFLILAVFLITIVLIYNIYNNMENKLYTQKQIYNENQSVRNDLNLFSMTRNDGFWYWMDTLDPFQTGLKRIHVNKTILKDTIFVNLIGLY